MLCSSNALKSSLIFFFVYVKIISIKKKKKNWLSKGHIEVGDDDDHEWSVKWIDG